MKRARFILTGALIGLIGLLGYTYSSRSASAQSERSQEAGPPEIIPHRINGHGADSFALTTGGTTPTSPSSGTGTGTRVTGLIHRRASKS